MNAPGRHTADTDNVSIEFLLRAWQWSAEGDGILFLGCGLASAVIGYTMAQAYRVANVATVAPFEYIALPLVGLDGKAWVLAIDRINWDFGKTTINILTISVEWRGVGIPLLWTLLPKAGNSSTAERIDLLGSLKHLFADMKIASFTGDREFIGQEWMAFLANQKVPFTLRLRENQYVSRDSYPKWTLARHAHSLKPGGKKTLRSLWRLGASDLGVRIVMMWLKTGELLALVTSGRPSTALARYRARWKIETLFGILKTRSFDMEATHLSDESSKLSLL